MPNPVPLQLFRKQAPVSLWERNRTGHTFGELTPDDLSVILKDAKDGDIEQWIELCSYSLETDLHMQSLIDTRKRRVLGDGTYTVTPGLSMDATAQSMAGKAAKLCDNVLSNIRKLNTKLLTVLDAIGHGVSAHELEWAIRDGAYVVKDLRWVHGRRFKWDEDWNLRLYDYGTNTGSSDYGEELIKDCWLIHLCQERGTYPGEAGIIRSCIWPWLFKMWVNRYHIHATERCGQPFISATIPAGSKPATRSAVLAKLEQLSYDTVGVFEEGTEIVFQGGPSTVNNGEMFDKYLTRADESQTKAILGATDIVDPGVHGSQSAVETRSEMTLDPRTMTDREQLCDSIEVQIFEPVVRRNMHLFTGVLPPTPKLMIGARPRVTQAYEPQGLPEPQVTKSQPEPTVEASKKKLNRSHLRTSTQQTLRFSTNPLERVLLGE